MRRALSALLILLSGCMPHYVDLVEKSGDNAAGMIERPAGHIILSAENSPGTWVPTEADVAIVESELALLFAKPHERFKEKRDARLSEYWVRYYGVVRDGKRLIVGEGTHVSQTDLATFEQMNSKPDTVLLPPYGGGRMHFTVIYDVDQKKSISVQFNAPL